LQEGLQKGLQEGLQKGLHKGRQEGLQEGLQEGRQGEKLAIARSALREKLSADTVGKLTGLPLEEIQRLAAELVR
jgi:predicted transposase YdaD